MDLSHIGIATNDLEKLMKEYIDNGYKVVSKVYDATQLATLVLLSKENVPNIELVYTRNELSKVYNTCKNNYRMEYHKCYKVKDLLESIKALKEKNYLQITNIEYAPLLKTKICFMYSKESGLIELEEINELDLHI